MKEKRDDSAGFLFGERLGKKIREVASGKKVCCAIAFWSKDGVAEIFPDSIDPNAKIVCDISMGATSAEALETLGGPSNVHLRHHLGMHAKVCFSNLGLVVSSANASRAAMGSDVKTGHHLEAGVFHAPDSEAWHEAVTWFMDLFNRASPVGPDEIAWAKLVYRPIIAARSRPPRRGSLLDLVIAAPERFKTIGFVFVRRPVTKQLDTEVRHAAGDIASDLVDSLPTEGVFADWNATDAMRWPARFFEFWQPKERLSVFCRRLEVRVPSKGSIMSIRDKRGLQKVIGTKLPSMQDVAKTDAALALRVLGASDHGIFFASGVELAQRLAELEAEEI